MLLFKYRALDENDCIIESSVKALSVNDAKILIAEKGFTPISISQASAIDNLDIELFQSIKIQDIISFCRELAIIIKSGINLSSGLEILRKQSSGKLKEAIYGVEIEIQKGRTLAQAMKESKYRFPELLIKMIFAGQSSGNLDIVLENMADYYERENYIKQKIRSATTYPIILLTFGGILLWFFSYFVLPSLEELMVGQNLPVITKVVLALANFIASMNFVYLILAIIIIVLIVVKIAPRQKLHRIKDSLILKLPMFGGVVKDIITVRFINTLYLLNKSGINIVNVLELLKDVISNTLAEEMIDFSLEGIKRGERLGDMLNVSGFLDPLVVQMISIGEETGELDQILDEVSKFYERKLELKIEKLISLIEPAFTIFIGGFIGIIIIAIALPLFSMTTMIDNSGVGIE